MTETHQDSQSSVWVRFVHGVVKGEYNDKLVFLAMIQATVMAMTGDLVGLDSSTCSVNQYMKSSRRNTLTRRQRSWPCNN